MLGDAPKYKGKFPNGKWRSQRFSAPQSGWLIPSGPRISGHVLKVIRESTGMTQERFAEPLGLDVTTIQGWESGRRPLMAISTGTYLSSRHWLLRLGIRSRLLFQLDMALEADRFVGHVLGTEPGKARAEDHPLASWVITRPLTDLVAWPFTGTAPSAMAGTARGTGRRGPVATSPSLLPDERAHFFEHLKVVAERADTGRAAGKLDSAIPYLDVVGPHAVVTGHTAPLDIGLEAVCARDADKLECLMQAVEYREQGHQNVQPWIDSSLAALRTASAKRLADEVLSTGSLEWMVRVLNGD
ncbi:MULTISPECIES: helix-turn-helix domain-containing protein [unclassified Nonomuraea]|uniref:helix-turn-helix domain-containing protein n=1 Tax=unclassified Nonomuraea TaxID=2593643 RepID=UPI00340E4E7B